jgi:hypothetical protein
MLPSHDSEYTQLLHGQPTSGRDATARQMTMRMACVWFVVFEAAAIAIVCSGLLMLIVICTACF